MHFGSFFDRFVYILELKEESDECVNVRFLSQISHLKMIRSGESSRKKNEEKASCGGEDQRATAYHVLKIAYNLDL